MLNRYPLWKNLLIVLVLVIAGIYAAPNLYPEDFAVQVSGTREAYTVDPALMSNLETELEQAGVEYKAAELNDGTGLLRFANGDAQLRAKDLIAEQLGNNYVVALNLAHATPTWLR